MNYALCTTSDKLVAYPLAKAQLNPGVVFPTFAIILFNLGRNRLVGQWCESETMTPLARWVVKRLRVVGNALVPDEHGTSLIPNPALEILSLGDVVKEKSEEIV